MEYNLSQIGSKFKYIREQHKLKQEELASALNLDVSTISAIERNTRAPSVATVVKFCNYFKVSADYLLSINSGYSTDSNILDLNLNFEDYISVVNLSTEEKKTLKKLIEHIENNKIQN